MKPKVYIRVDGDAEIGLGHLIRCIALAHMLKNDFDIIFICISVTNNIKDELDNNFQLQVITHNDNLFEIIKPENIVVLDGYHFDVIYQKRIKALGCILICIDDLHDKEFYADLVINHSPAIQSNDYKAQSYTQFALGPEYALLRPVFLKQAQKKRIVEEIRTVFICFGGADYLNLTMNVLSVVQDCNMFEKVIVVTGSAYTFLNTLQDYKEHNTKIYHYHIIDENHMLSLMLESDLAIIPASGILLESLTAGCVVISGMYADNQKLVYSNYKKLNCFIDAFDFNKTSLTNAIKNIDNIGNKPSQFIDGNSGKRILELFIQQELKHNLKLRFVTTEDLEITYKWAIDPIIRLYSFKKNIITKDEHINWFQTKLKSDKCFYFIAEIYDDKVGCLRFDIYKNELIISYLIDPKYQGKGLGQVMLTLGIEYMKSIKKTTKLSFQKIIGYVMKENIPSIRIFEKMKFKQYDEVDKFKFENLIL